MKKCWCASTTRNARYPSTPSTTSRLRLTCWSGVFTVEQRDQTYIVDITNIRMQKDWLYLAVFIDQ